MSPMRWLAAAFTALLLLTGCGGSDDEAEAPETSEAAETEAAEDTTEPAEDEETEEEPAESEQPAEADLPDGHQWVTAEKSGVRFAAPEGWQVAGPELLDNPGSEAELELFAENSGMTADQLRAAAGQVDVIVINPDGGSNLNVIPPGMVPSLPTAEFLETNFSSLGATVSDVEDVETPFGMGRMAVYELPATTGTAHGASLFVESDNGVINLTGTTPNDTLAARITKDAAATLHYAD